MNSGVPQPLAVSREQSPNTTVQFLVTREFVMRLCRPVNLSVHPARLLEATAGECDEPGYNMAYW